MESKSITLRDQASGKLYDLLQADGVNCAHTQGLALFFVGALANYREEGAELSPTIVVCANIVQLMKAAPGAVSYEIGSGELNPDVGKRVLKECAVLATNGWFIYIERTSADFFKFGVASYPLTPTALRLEDVIQLDGTDFAFLIKKTAQSTVEFLGRKGGRLSVIFSTTRDGATSSFQDEIRRFANRCSNSIDEDARSAFVTYFADLVDRALNASHGSILLCVSDQGLSKLSDLQDVIRLEPALDFYRAYSEYKQSSAADVYVRLRLNEDLLIGLLQSDGVVAFNDFGSVIAYRGFYRPSSVQPATGSVVGGARRRAFEGMANLVGSDLKAVLFRSQDGLTLYRSAKDE